ncbi:hypothetical protein J3459_006023 [Metarhizium acridum]|nr:hypothetical protein J3459_006023 [Metarhizium acridum]
MPVLENRACPLGRQVRECLTFNIDDWSASLSSRIRPSSIMQIKLLENLKPQRVHVFFRGSKLCYAFAMGHLGLGDTCPVDARIVQPVCSIWRLSDIDCPNPSYRRRV